VAGSVTLRSTGEVPPPGRSSSSTTVPNCSAIALAISAACPASVPATVMSICEVSTGLTALTRSRTTRKGSVSPSSSMTGPRTARLRATSG
jgi:hypothetical protein